MMLHTAMISIYDSIIKLLHALTGRRGDTYYQVESIMKKKFGCSDKLFAHNSFKERVSKPNNIVSSSRFNQNVRILLFTSSFTVKFGVTFTKVSNTFLKLITNLVTLLLV